MKQYLKEFIHNVIIHPLMMFMPSNLAAKMHDRNGDWAFNYDHLDELKLENKK